MMLDYDESQFSFAINRESKFSASIEGPPEPSNELSGWVRFAIFLLVLAFIGVVLASAYFAFTCHKKRTESRSASAIAYNHI